MAVGRTTIATALLLLTLFAVGCRTPRVPRQAEYAQVAHTVQTAWEGPAVVEEYVNEAHAAGLVFDAPLLDHYVNSGSDPIRHNPLNAMYRVDNLMLKGKMALAPKGAPSPFTAGLRRLTNDNALSLRIASSAVNHFQAGDYAPPNVQALADTPEGFAGMGIETVQSLPEAGIDLAPLGRPVPAGSAGQP